MNHSEAAIALAKGSTWDLDAFAEKYGWEGVGIIYTHNRDSDGVEKSNWDVITDNMIYDPYFQDTQMAYFNHWAVGWVEYYCYDTRSTTITGQVKEIHEKLANYPLLNEAHYMENYGKEEDDEIQ